ncbi:fimbrial protein [Achromobacter sp. PAB15]|uniref:fimbrial protein n=1 Tax=Achromobacter sp. PAB15 TaxID=3233048 RepID=UPI003F924483
MASRGVLRRLGTGGLAGVLLAVAAPMAWGQSTQKGLIAGNCTWSNKLGSRWNPLRPQLSSAAQVSDVLSERSAFVTTDFTYEDYGDPSEEYELIVAAIWEPRLAVDQNGWAKTNVPGISMAILANGQAVLPGNLPVVVAKHALAVNDGKPKPKHDSVHTALIQQLVLASPLDQLPSNGPQSVTGVALGAGFALYAMSFPKGNPYQLGQTIPRFPSYPAGPQVCVSTKLGPLLGSGIMGLGAGGSEVVFSNACEAGLTQTKTVELGSYSLRDFPGQGATSEEKPFDITLSKCSALAKPKISFTAKHGASADKTVLKLDPKVDDRGLPPAKGVGIVMINAATNKRIEFGKFYDMARAGADSASIFLRASYLRTAAHPAQMAGGHANGTAEFTIEFP